MPTEKIKIAKLARKQQPSKYKQGETYSITTIMDEKGRKIAGLGQWTENWKVGDEIEGDVQEKKWTDRDGFEQTSLTINNPNQKSWSGRSGFQQNPKIISYQLAASLAPLLFAGKKSVKLEDIDKLAEELKSRIDSSSTTSSNSSDNSTTQQDKTPELNLDNEEGGDDDSDEPF